MWRSNEPFPPQVVVGQCFITATGSQTRENLPYDISRCVAELFEHLRRPYTYVHAYTDVYSSHSFTRLSQSTLHHHQPQSRADAGVSITEQTAGLELPIDSLGSSRTLPCTPLLHGNQYGQEYGCAFCVYSLQECIF